MVSVICNPGWQRPLLLNSIPAAEVCDATEADQGYAAGFIKLFTKQILLLRYKYRLDEVEAAGFIHFFLPGKP